MAENREIPKKGSEEKLENDQPRMQIGVIGAGECGAELAACAEETGRLIAASGAVLVCGGRGGVMEAACRGARRAGGLTVGILPGFGDENPFCTVRVGTGLGVARNAVVVGSSDALVAIGGRHGTLSEIAMARVLGKEVFGLDTWEIDGVVACKTPGEAVRSARDAARRFLRSGTPPLW